MSVLLIIFHYNRMDYHQLTLIICIGDNYRQAWPAAGPETSYKTSDLFGAEYQEAARQSAVGREWS